MTRMATLGGASGSLEAQPDDPLQHSPEGSLIWQFDAKSRYALAHDDLAVVKFCT
jgi:hypothetical protein